MSIPFWHPHIRFFKHSWKTLTPFKQLTFNKKHLYVSPIRSNSSPPEQYSRKRYIVRPSFRCPKNRTMLAWLSIYDNKIRTLYYCAEIRMLSPILHVKLTYLVNADLFLDIVSTIFCLRSVNYFNSHSLLRKSVHQQPDPGSKEKLRMKRMQEVALHYIHLSTQS